MACLEKQAQAEIHTKAWKQRHKWQRPSHVRWVSPYHHKVWESRDMFISGGSVWGQGRGLSWLLICLKRFENDIASVQGMRIPTARAWAKRTLLVQISNQEWSTDRGTQLAELQLLHKVRNLCLFTESQVIYRRTKNVSHIYRTQSYNLWVWLTLFIPTRITFHYYSLAHTHCLK